MNKRPVQLNGASLLRDGSKPLYLQLQELLRDYMATPEALAAGRLPTEQELAEMLEVSRSTVSQALKLLAEEGLICRIKHRGTVLTAAQDKFDPQAQKSSLGLVFPISQGWRQAIAAMEKQALAAGYHFELYSYRWNDEADEQRSFERARKNCAGLILYPNGLGTDLEFIRQLIKNGTKFVLFDLYYESVDCNIVSSNNFLSMYLLVSRLLEQGFRRPGLLLYYPHLITAQRRMAGWRQALEDHGIQPAPEWILHDSDDTPPAKVRAWLDKNKLDAMASIKSCSPDKAILRPLVQCDIQPDSKALLAAVQSEEELGAAAVDLLLEAIGTNGRACRQILISPIITG